MLRGQHLADAGIPRGKLWSYIVTQSEEAQDDGLFTDEAGAQAWLATNHEAILTEAARRLQQAEAAHAEKKAARQLALQARRAEQKTAAREAKALRAEPEQAAAVG